MSLNNLLHAPGIARNLIFVSKFAKDNNVFFVFHCNYCFVKSQASKEVLLEGFLDAGGLYYFHNLPMDSSPQPAVNYANVSHNI